MEINGIPYPVIGELNDQVCRQLAGGQPLLLCRDGRPAAIVIDVESWAEVEAVLREEYAAD